MPPRKKRCSNINMAWGAALWLWPWRQCASVDKVCGGSTTRTTLYR